MKKTIIMIAALAAISFTPIVFAVQHKPVIKHHVVHVVKKHHKLDGHIYQNIFLFSQKHPQ